MKCSKVIEMGGKYCLLELFVEVDVICKLFGNVFLCFVYGFIVIE